MKELNTLLYAGLIRLDKALAKGTAGSDFTITDSQRQHLTERYGLYSEHNWFAETSALLKFLANETKVPDFKLAQWVLATELTRQNLTKQPSCQVGPMRVKRPILERRLELLMAAFRGFEKIIDNSDNEFLVDSAIELGLDDKHDVKRSMEFVKQELRDSANKIEKLLKKMDSADDDL